MMKFTVLALSAAPVNGFFGDLRESLRDRVVAHGANFLKTKTANAEKQILDLVTEQLKKWTEKADVQVDTFLETESVKTLAANIGISTDKMKPILTAFLQEFAGTVNEKVKEALKNAMETVTNKASQLMDGNDTNTSPTPEAENL